MRKDPHSCNGQVSQNRTNICDSYETSALVCKCRHFATSVADFIQVAPEAIGQKWSAAKSRKESSMAYLDIDNPYKNQDILLFAEALSHSPSRAIHLRSFSGCSPP